MTLYGVLIQTTDVGNLHCRTECAFENRIFSGYHVPCGYDDKQTQTQSRVVSRRV